MRVSKRVQIACAHILDLPYESKCNMLHGHNYTFTAMIEGDINDNGMVVDYTILGRAMKRILDDWDHKFFVPEERIVGESENEVTVNYPSATVTMLKETAILMPGHQSTAENIAVFFHTRLVSELQKEGIVYHKFNLTVKVQETDGTESVYP